ncbi:MAG TPA: glycosyltransferase family 2 protein [Opitutaceae bacterium]|nr:glycosyltransferase family 2 protein [Opitutaceae bacterium]
MPRSASHLVLIPSYNSGPRLLPTVLEALKHWQPVWVVVDGSTDRSFEPVEKLAAERDDLRVIHRPKNGGKGAAVLTGAEAAIAAGFTHGLVMDSDGQHPADHIERFMAASQAAPAASVLGVPQFGPEVPLERLHGRKLSVGLVKFETLGGGVDDPLFGFRVYPLAPLVQSLRSTRHARGFDFDPEVAVRMFWNGVPTINLPAPCRYLSKADGGVSHFHYVRDNLKMIWLHTRLILQLLLWRWPAARRAKRNRLQSVSNIHP